MVYHYHMCRATRPHAVLKNSALFTSQVCRFEFDSWFISLTDVCQSECVFDEGAVLILIALGSLAPIC